MHFMRRVSGGLSRSMQPRRLFPWPISVSRMPSRLQTGHVRVTPLSLHRCRRGLRSKLLLPELLLGEDSPFGRRFATIPASRFSLRERGMWQDRIPGGSPFTPCREAIVQCLDESTTEGSIHGCHNNNFGASRRILVEICLIQHAPFFETRKKICGRFSLIPNNDSR